MGYTLTIAVVRRVQPLLEELLTSSLKNEERVWKSDDPGRLAHRLREALFASAVNSSKDEMCQRYAELRERYTIKALRDGVKAESRSRSLHVKVETSLSKLRLPEVTELAQAIGAAIIHDRTDEIHFPSIPLEGQASDELVKFVGWARTSLWFVVNNYDDGFTLVKNDPGELKWEPK